MKRTVITILSSLALLLPLHAATDDDRAISEGELPAAAREFISMYFRDVRPALVKEERDFPDISYEIVFTTGAKVEFDRHGAWTEVSCRYSEMPGGIVPRQLVEKAREFYPDAAVTQIERGRHGYEMKLDNGLELTFGSDFRLLDIDD